MLVLFHLGYSRGHRDRLEQARVSTDGEKVLIKPYCAPEIESYMKRVDELTRTQEYEAAIENLREAIRICPTSAVAHNNLGCVLGNLRRFEEAEKEFIEALELSAADPYAPTPYVDASNNLARLRGYKLKFNFGDDVKLLWKASRSRKKRSG